MINPGIYTGVFLIRVGFSRSFSLPGNFSNTKVLFLK